MFSGSARRLFSCCRRSGGHFTELCLAIAANAASFFHTASLIFVAVDQFSTMSDKCVCSFSWCQKIVTGKDGLAHKVSSITSGDAGNIETHRRNVLRKLIPTDNTQLAKVLLKTEILQCSRLALR